MGDHTSVLRIHGLKPTPQRLAILAFLAETKAHPSAQTIHDSLKPAYPAMSLNTVYTTLDAMKAAGLIQRFDPGQGAFRYDGNPAPHAHVTCLKCARVDDVETEPAIALTQMVQEVSQHIPYRLAARVDVVFYGLCPDCQEDGPGQKEREELK